METTAYYDYSSLRKICSLERFSGLEILAVNMNGKGKEVSFENPRSSSKRKKKSKVRNTKNE